MEQLWFINIVPWFLVNTLREDKMAEACGEIIFPYISIG